MLLLLPLERFSKKEKTKKRKARTKNMCEVSTPFEFELKLGCKKISYPLL